MIAQSILPFGPWYPDLPAFGNPGTAYVHNVLPTAKGYRPFRALEQYRQARLAGRCHGAVGLRDNNGVSRNFAGTSNKIYRLDGGQWVDVSRTQDGDYATPEEAKWQFIQFGNLLIAQNGADVPQKLDLNGEGLFEPLEGTPPTAQYMTVVRDFVLLGNLAQDANIIRWSALNDAEAWDIGIDLADQQVLPEGGRVQGVTGGEVGYVFQDDAIRRLTYVGLPLIFQIDTVETGRGVLAPYSIVKVGRLVYYLGHDGFYVFDGFSSRPIGAERVDRTFFADLDRRYVNRIHGAADPLNSTVIWCYPASDNVDGLCNKLLIYNWALDRWSQASLAVETVFPALSAGISLDALAVDYPNLDLMPFSLDSPAWSGGILQLAAFSAEHGLSYFGGPALPASLETAEAMIYSNRQRRALVTSLLPAADADRLTARIATRNRLADPAQLGPPSMLLRNGRCPVRSAGLYHRARIDIPSAADWQFADGIQFESHPDGVR